MVRMWGLDENFMCRKHLLGEHVEMHMIVGSIARGRSVEGYTSTGLLRTQDIKERHDYIADAMTKRGYNHASPLEYVDTLGKGWLDTDHNADDLFKRCSLCRYRWHRFLIEIKQGREPVINLYLPDQFQDSSCKHLTTGH